jgi:hypothetical protein
MGRVDIEKRKEIWKNHKITTVNHQGNLKLKRKIATNQQIRGEEVNKKAWEPSIKL